MKKPTDQQIKDLAEAIEADRDGKPWEFYSSQNEKWLTAGNNIGDPTFCWRQGILVRAKPKPQTREWRRPEDLPKVGSIWLKDKQRNIQFLVDGTFATGVYTREGFLHWEKLDAYLWADNPHPSANWQPCKVEVQP